MATRENSDTRLSTTQNSKCNKSGVGWGGDASQSRREHAAGAAGVIYEQIWELNEEK